MSDLLNYQQTVLTTLSNGGPFAKPNPTISTQEFKKKQLVSFYLYVCLEKLSGEIVAKLEDALLTDYNLSYVFFVCFPVTLFIYYLLYKKLFVNNLTQGIIQ